MIQHKDIEKVIGKNTLITDNLQAAIQLWDRVLRGAPISKDSDGLTLELPGAVSERLANLATMELSVKAQGSDRADWIDRKVQSVLSPRKLSALTRAVGLGSGIYLPYQSGQTVGVDFVDSTGFYPVEENADGELSEVVFVDTVVVSDSLVYHRLTHMHCVSDPLDITDKERDLIELSDVEAPQELPCVIITTQAFEARTRNELGKEVPLKSRNEWYDIPPVSYLTGIDYLPLGYYVNQIANSIEPGSPVGASIFARGLNAMAQADKQYARLDWEYKAGEMAIDADSDYLKETALDRQAQTKNRYTSVLPEGKERLFRGLKHRSGEDFYHVFSPALRDESYLRGLDQYLRDVESHCGLAFGELSKVSDVAKTAQEVKASKQRMYQTVSYIQAGLEQAIRELVRALDFWADVLCPYNADIPASGTVDLSFAWDDSILNSRQEEMATWQTEISLGLRSKQEYRERFFGESPEAAEEAIKAIEASDGDVFDEE